MAEKITIEEYNRQSNEYTKQALRQLREQMKTQAPSTSRIIVNGNDFEDSSDNDIDNLIIKHITNKTNKTTNSDKTVSNHENIIADRKPRINRRIKSNSNNEKEGTSSLNEVIYAQRELDMKTIQSLKEIVKQLQSELDNEARKNHFLKLDLNNSDCDNSDMKKQIIVLKEDNEKHKKIVLEYKDRVYKDGIYMMVMKIIIVLLIFLVFVW